MTSRGDSNMSSGSSTIAAEQSTTMEHSETSLRAAAVEEERTPQESSSPGLSPGIAKSSTQDFGKDDGMSTPKRVQTAPIERQKRPPMGSRKTTLLSGLRRSGTNLQPPSLIRGDTFQYQFKEAPLSDSDSSDSSEDEEEIHHSVTGPQEEVRPTEQIDGAGGTNETSTQTARRRYAYSRFTIGNDLFKTKGRVSRKDGRLKISIKETANSGYVAKALGQSIRNHLDIPTRDCGKRDRVKDQKKKDQTTEDDASSIEALYHRHRPRPRLNIVIMVIGSRGDIQPFLQIGKLLRHQHGHRVRIATHPVFRDFVERDGGLEFFSVGGDPSELMAFMVKNPGLIPSMQTLREGEIGRRRTAMAEMFEGFWRACINTTDGETDEENLKTMRNMEPFIADAIIANPPSMAHVHIAERLSIPLHIMFTFPYSPTTAFPHPLANIRPRKSNVDANYVNFMSYPLVEMMTWQGLGDIVNHFREDTLRLEPVSSLWAPGALYRMKVPYTYLWSPSLVPKPRDWGPEIDIGGFVFLNLATNFKPPKELTDFLDAGDPPVYIGFGSIVVDDPDQFTDMIFKAVKMAGVRALVNKGWGGLGQHNSNTPDYIFMLDNTPHDWLFPRVKAVVHHGGAGTTAIGLKCARPTMIVPFFGDQPFWGAMVAEAKAGAFECIPYKRLTVERLAEGIKQCLTPEAQENVQKIADSICEEGDGAENAVRSFHRSLPLSGRHSMRCSILQDRVAVWKVHKSTLRLSALAAQILHKDGKLKWGDLKLVRHHEWNDFDGPGEPVTGGVGALTDSLYGIGEGFGMVPVRIARHIREREEHERRKRARQKKKADRERRKAEEAVQAKREQHNHINGENGDVAGLRPRRELTNDTLASTASADNPDNLPQAVVDDFHWGLKRAGIAILTMPNDLHVAVAQGFHNAPRLYGDSTVRKPTKITGFKSGLLAARKEFAYGIYDGWTGLVKQPVGDWSDGETLPAKFAGLGTGLGKGIGGFAIKNMNALYAPPGYVLKGLIKYAENRHAGPGSKSFIRRSRVVQGENELWSLEKNDSEESKVELQKVHDVVQYGWIVYERIWHEAHKEFGPVGGNVVGRYRMRKEQKMWDVNGLLEDVDTANCALRSRLEGKDLNQLFGKHREQLRLRDQQARTPGMELTQEDKRGEENNRIGLPESAGDGQRSDGLAGVSEENGTAEEEKRITEIVDDTIQQPRTVKAAT